jgi:hypothetical protein
MTFELGQVLITRSALAFAEAHQVDVIDFVRRHHSGDWGDLGGHDKALNDAAVLSGRDRIFSAYGAAGERFYVITEHDRSSTCVMLASDY